MYLYKGMRFSNPTNANSELNPFWLEEMQLAKKPFSSLSM